MLKNLIRITGLALLAAVGCKPPASGAKVASADDVASDAAPGAAFLTDDQIEDYLANPDKNRVFGSSRGLSDVEAPTLSDFDELGFSEDNRIPMDLDDGDGAGGGLQLTGGGGADLRKNDSPIRNQKTRGSCATFATIAGIENQARHGGSAGGDLSEEQLWNEVGQAATSIDNALATAAAKPRITEASWPYFGSRRGNAVGGNLTNYQQVAGLAAMLGALDAGNPVVFGFKTTEEFMRAPRGVIPPTGTPHSGKHGGHAVLAVGYKRSTSPALGGGWLIIRNSWDTTWGDRGYGYLPFSYCNNFSCFASVAVTGAQTVGSGGNGGGGGGSGASPIVKGWKMSFGLEPVSGGLRVAQLEKSGLAAKIGFDVGDVITGINGTDVHALADYDRLMATAGASIILDILPLGRGPEKSFRVWQNGKVTRPPGAATTTGGGGAGGGGTGGPWTMGFGIAGNGAGVEIITLKGGGLAQNLGFEIGDVITSINGRAVRNMTDYDRAMATAGPSIDVSVLPRGAAPAKPYRLYKTGKTVKL